jgi:cobalt-zinc-cadmium efflux system outer membrane protein
LSRCYLAWLLLATPLTWAQEPQTELPPLTLPEAAARVLEQNPRLMAGEYSRAAADAATDSAGMNPQWSVGLDIDNFLGTGVLSGLDGSETTLRLSRIFQPSNIRDGRVSVAGAQSASVDNALESERLDLMALLARRFVEVVYQQEQLALADQAVETWQRATGLALERERAGAAPAVHRLQTEIRTARAKLMLEDAEHELDAARLLLAATWGDTDDDFGAASASVCAISPLPSFERLAEQIDHNPDLMRFATDQRLYEAESRLAEARSQPGWSLSAGVRHLALIDEQAVVFSVSVPLGSRSRSEPVVRRSNALRQQSALREKDVRTDSRATLYELYQETLHLITEVKLYEDEILPKAGEILRQTEEGYRLGRFSHLELLNAQAELLAARAARLSACTNHQLFLIDIERLTGGGVVWLTTEGGVTP